VNAWSLSPVEAEKLSYGVSIEATKLGAEKLSEAIEKPIEELLKVVFTSNYGIGPGAVRRGLTEESARILKMRQLSSVFRTSVLNSKGWRAVFNGKAGPIPTLASIPASVVTELAAIKIEDAYRTAVARAWTEYLLADRSAHGQTVALHITSTIYWALKRSYDRVAQAEEQFLEKEAPAPGFHVAISEPFDDGADVVVTTSPALEVFKSAGGDLGGETLILHRKGYFTIVAKSLGGRGKYPRLVTLTLRLG
jgi:hypothetical protein